MKFKFKCEPNKNEQESSVSFPTIDYEFEATSLTELVEMFEMFVRGCGFHPKGQLDFFEDETESDYLPEWDGCCGYDEREEFDEELESACCGDCKCDEGKEG